MNESRPLAKLLYGTVLFAYLLFLLWLVLFKFSLHIPETFDFQIRGLNLIPFAGIAQDSSRDPAYNVLFFVPFGLLLSVNLKRTTFWRKLTYIFFFSLAVEIIQFIFAIGITDITDVIMNTAGGLLGLILYSLNQRYLGSKKIDQWATVTIGTMVVLLFAFIFSIQLSHDKHRPKLPAKTIPSQMNQDKDIQLAWPSTGEAAVADVEDKLLARSSDSEEQRPTASMAKVIAALAIMEKQPLEPGQQGPAYTVTENDVENLHAYVAEDGSVLPLRIGMKVTQYQALQRMLIASDDSMADMLTERVFGSKEAYVSYTQDMLARMGLSRTVVADASGFSSDTVSTPSELITIGIAALKNPVIAGIVAQQQANIPGVGSIENTNQLLGTSGVIGIKTGTTDEAGSCLLFAARYTAENGKVKTIVGVIMGDTDHSSLYYDSNSLLTSAKEGFGLTDDQPPVEAKNDASSYSADSMDRTLR